MATELRNKVALITRGTCGIGRTMAEALAEHGWN
jgi:NAD(P)-dependent dehydrogenase (short-subunit alcohol dehydrogenase family)